MAPTITGFEDVSVLEEPASPPEHRTAADVDLWRSYHPPATPAPRSKTLAAGSSTPEPSLFERWVSQPLSNFGAWLGGLATAPIRALKTTGLWLGGGLLILAVLAIVALVIGLRFVRIAEGR